MSELKSVYSFPYDKRKPWGEKRVFVAGGHRFTWKGQRTTEDPPIFQGQVVLYCHNRDVHNYNEGMSWFKNGEPQLENKEPTNEELDALAQEFYEKLGNSERFYVSPQAENDLRGWVPEGCPCIEKRKEEEK